VTFAASGPGCVPTTTIPVGFSSALQRQRGGDTRHHFIEFQSLSGFQVRCNFAKDNGAKEKTRVSIPVGFSSALQQLKLAFIDFLMPMFQSLSGFQVRCNNCYVVIIVEIVNGFQSLSGFQVRCNGGSKMVLFP
jgi:hypothetical protein